MATAVEVKAETLSFVPSPTVPVVGDLASVYTEAVPEERYNKITTAFELAFGSKPEFYARAPGKWWESSEPTDRRHGHMRSADARAGTTRCHGNPWCHLPFGQRSRSMALCIAVAPPTALC